MLRLRCMRLNRGMTQVYTHIHMYRERELLERWRPEQKGSYIYRTLHPVAPLGQSKECSTFFVSPSKNKNVRTITARSEGWIKPRV